MATDVRLEQIRNGVEFQALVNSLLLEKNPRNHAFTWPGPDGGQDARSDDGTTVFQARHFFRPPLKHELRAVIREKLDEVRKHHNEGHGSWLGVTHWVLVTNAPKPPEAVAWLAEFSDDAPDGVSIDVWYEPDVQSLLAACPNTRRMFFETEDRAFLTYSEKRERLCEDEQLLLGKPAAEQPREPRIFAVADAVGREELIDDVSETLAEPRRAVLIHGPGGVGKSRLGWEVARRLLESGAIEQAYWANTLTLAATPGRPLELFSGRPILAVVDDPSPELVGRLLEQLAASRQPGENWRLLFTARTSDRPVMHAFDAPQHQAVKGAGSTVELKPLERDPARRLAIALMTAVGFADKWEQPGTTPSQFLVERYKGFPLWLMVGVGWWKRRGHEHGAVEDPQGFARDYIRNLCERVGMPYLQPDFVRDLLRWIALYQPVDRADDTFDRFLVEELGLGRALKLREALDQLARVGAVRAYGRDKRLLRVEPDPIRDRIVTEWLAPERDTDGGTAEPSAAASELVRRLVAAVSAGRDVDHPTLPAPGRLVEGLGRLAWQTGLRRELLGPLARHVLDVARRAVATRENETELRLAWQLAHVLPGDTAAIVRAVRERLLPPPAKASHADIEFARTMVRTLSRAARVAVEPAERSAIADEFVAFIGWEASTPKSQGPASRERRLVGGDAWRDILHAIGTALSSFTPEARPIADDCLDDLASEAGRPRLSSDAIGAVLEPMLAVERREDFSDGATFTMQRYLIRPESPEGTLRRHIRGRLWDLLRAGRAPARNLILAWQLVRHRGMYQEPGDASENLHLAVTVLGERVEQMSLEELCAAREIWEWHLHYEEDQALRGLAERCEARFIERTAMGDLARVLVMEGLDDDAPERITAVARTVAGAETADELRRQFERARQLAEAAEPSGLTWQLAGLARQVGVEGRARPPLRRYVQDALSEGRDGRHWPLAIEVLRGWLAVSRERVPGELVEELRSFLGEVPDDPSRAELVVNAIAPESSAPDRDLLEQNITLLLAHVPEAAFGLLGRLGVAEWPRFTRLVEGAWASVDVSLRGACYRRMFDALRIHDRRVKQAPSADALDRLRWQMDQLVEVPHLNELEHHIGWHLAQLAGRGLRLSVSWFHSFFEARLARYGAEGGRVFYVSGVPGSKVPPLPVVRRLESAVGSDAEAFRSLWAHVRGDARWRDDLVAALAKLDPDGLLVPDLVIAELARLGLPRAARDVTSWSEAARSYAIDTPPWLEIARTACALAERTLSPDDVFWVYHSLLPQFGESWESVGGAVDPKWPRFVETARAAKEGEPPGSPLTGFRAWNLKRLERDFARWMGEREEDQEA